MPMHMYYMHMLALCMYVCVYRYSHKLTFDSNARLDGLKERSEVFGVGGYKFVLFFVIACYFFLAIHSN